MVKVFRRFRLKWLKDGQGQKYFLYAIGEIFLVVIGILIALSINNWNNDKELRKAEKQIYHNILRRINEDKSDIQGNVHYNNKHMVQFQYANEIIEANDRTKMDTLGIILFKLFKYSNYSGSENIYQNLLNSGDIKFLKNDAIVGELQELEELYIFMNRLEENHWEAIMRFVGPGIVDNIHISNLEVERPDELYAFQAQNLIFAMTGIMSEKDSVYQATIRQIDSIDLMIKQEINQ